MSLGEEINSFIKVWLTVLTSLCYCYTIGKIVPKGFKRFIFILPILPLFLFLPLNLHSPHLGGFTGFFVGWLANFKLLLFAFDHGPLNTQVSLPLFLTLASLPIKIQTNPSSSPKSHEKSINYVVKGVSLGILVWVYEYKQYMHPVFVLLVYSLHIYLMLEIMLAIGAATVRLFSGLELEPQFDEPFLSTSLQDFWGRRWNLMVTSILRPTVYEPTLRISSSVVGRKWAPLPSVFSTFVVSGVMHELMFYYLGHLNPNGEVTLFFLIHGFCLTVEIGLKKGLKGKCRGLPRGITGPLTVVFVLGTGFWLFIPQFTRAKVEVRAHEEYAELGALLKSLGEKVLRVFSAK